VPGPRIEGALICEGAVVAYFLIQSWTVEL
jgi:hypothetical protein